MIQNLLPLLPRGISTEVVLGVSFAGAALWLAGAKFSRSLLALAATGAGGVAGYQSPAWFGWNVDPLAVGVGCALGLGIIGFLGHRMLAVLGLGIVMACWGAMTAIACVATQHPKWSWAELNPFKSHEPELPVLPNLSDPVLLAALAAGLIGGILFGIVCKRLGVVLFWSLLGSAAAILALLDAARPHYLTLLPREPWEQGAFVLTAVAFGAAVQWRITFVRSSPKPVKTDQPR